MVCCTLSDFDFATLPCSCAVITVWTTEKAIRKKQPFNKRASNTIPPAQYWYGIIIMLKDDAVDFFCHPVLYNFNFIDYFLHYLAD